MENQKRDDVIGSRKAPFETQLAGECGTAASYAEVGSPSLPNYLGATSGSTHHVSDDAGPSSHPIDADNLFRQVRAAGGQSRTYAEAMPSPCATSSSGRYAVKHNPAAYYVGGDDRAACRRDNVSLGPMDGSGPGLATDLAAGPGGLPTLTVIIPDLCNDTHDCGVATGDTWLSRWVPIITGSQAFTSTPSALFIVWDEPTPMPFIAVSGSIRPGTVLKAAVDHYSLLRTTEQMLGLPLLGAATSATDMRTAFGL